ncbi:zinc-ribbon domain-containing protein [Paracoccus sp. p4-l81]|uniref:zinc-ribbon domain-containing protein n=1 Tax=Paracoccus sp. p4-l81 TaxID=3342806 RepID=UPI0035B92484
MRLTCPNCGAQYALADGVIPTEGRDVECSACNHIWFQRGAGALAVQPVRQPAPQPATQPATHPAPQPAQRPVPPRPAPGIDFAAFEDEAPPAPRLPDFPPFDTDDAPAPLPPPRRSLNDSLLAVLREEAEREAKARRAEAQRFEYQPDLGLPEPEPQAQAAPPVTPATRPDGGDTAQPDRDASPDAAPLPQEPADQPATPAPVEGTSAKAAPTPSAAPTPAREAPPAPSFPTGATLARPALPDPEAIGATLTTTRPFDPPRLPEPQPQAAPQPAAAPPRPGHGFAWGLLTALLILALAVSLYALAPRLAAAFPDLAPHLAVWVAWVDSLRAGLAGLVGR